MLIITVNYKARPNMRQEFYNAIQDDGLQEFFQHEAGCIKYDYYLPVNSQDEICLFEIWESVDAQKAHASTENFKKLRALKEKYIESSVVTRYNAEEVTRS